MLRLLQFGGSPILIDLDQKLVDQFAKEISKIIMLIVMVLRLILQMKMKF